MENTNNFLIFSADKKTAEINFFNGIRNLTTVELIDKLDVKGNFEIEEILRQAGVKI